MATVTVVTEKNHDHEVLLFADPDAIGVPCEFAAPPLPKLVDPAELPYIPVPAQADAEPLVVLEHERVVVLATYWESGSAFRPVGAPPVAYARAEVARRVERVAQSLPEGFSLAVFDAWRPLQLQRALYDAAYTNGALPAGFVSEPSDDPACAPPHLTGGALDVTLAWNGVPLELGTSFDAFDEFAHAASFEERPGRVRELRRLLCHSMFAAGFVVLSCEWWHFEFGTRRWSAITGESVRYGAAAVQHHTEPPVTGE